MKSSHEHPIYGLLAQFDSDDRLVDAAFAARRAGYCRFHVYSPFPIPKLFPLVESRLARMLLPGLILIGALTLGGGMYLLEYWTSVVDYPINVGGRPLHSFPSFVPSVVILAILGAATTAFLWLLILNRLPTLHHPLFNDPHFSRTTEESFYLCIKSDDPRFDPQETRRFLDSLAPSRLNEVPW